jgi:hypothetical protein
MKTFIPIVSALFFCSVFASGETLDEAINRFLAGETFSRKEIFAITDIKRPQPADGKKHNQGSTYLFQVKREIISPVDLRDWPIHSYLLHDERNQAITYRELKAIYEKDKTPVNAYALVCPAMYVNDFKLLPELIAKIGENKPLKAHFDQVYTTFWKPWLDPDL